jgi:PST family polysaccharide transporter
MVMLSGALIVIVSISSDLIITTLYGVHYQASVTILKVHVWSSIFVFLNNAVWAWYIIENKQSVANRRLIAGLVINVVLNYLLIPIYGAVGAAYATLASRAFASYFGHLLSPETSHLFAMMSRSLFTLGLAKVKK